MAGYQTVQTREEERVTSSAAQSGGRWWIWLVVIVLAGLGFWYYRSHSGASANAAAGGAAGAGGKGGGAPKSFVVPVVAATAAKGDLPVFFTGLGTVTAFNTVTVRSRIDGQLLTVGFKEGQYVKEGDLLAQIDPRPYEVQLAQAQGQLAKDESQRRDAEVNLERYKLLYNEGVIAKQQLDTQQASVGQSNGAIQTDKANIENAKLNLAYCRITAPISGRVGLRLVDPGNMVHASDANGIVVITQVQPIAVLFALPQDQLPEVLDKLHKGIELPVQAYDRDNTKEIAAGKLLTIDNQIDPTTGTYKLKAVFNNANNELFPNQFVNIRLLVNTLKNVVLVPTTAILRGPQGTYVFAVGQDSTVKLNVVKIAGTTGSTTAVSEGLSGGDVVVVDGQDKLQNGSKVDARVVGSGQNGVRPAAENQPQSGPTGFGSPAGGPAR